MLKLLLFSCCIASAQPLFASQNLSIEQMMLEGLQENTPPVTQQFDSVVQVHPIRMLIDVRSQHSDGAHDFTSLIQLAEKRGIQALAFNEHDRFSVRFGIEPIPSLLGYSQEHPSLYQTGVSKFFTDLARIQNKTTIQLLPGTESTAGYTWQGVPFFNLQLNNAERHLITLGASSPEQIQALSSYKLNHGFGSLNASNTFWIFLMLVGIGMWFLWHKHGFALLLFAISVPAIVTINFSSPSDADTAFITSAEQQGFFVIWAHPGTLSGIREGPMGVSLNTPPYNQEVFKKPAHAFAAVYGDTDANTKAGGLWDRYMMAFLKGYKLRPIWAVSAGDFHEEGAAGEYLGNFPMDVWAKSNKKEDILSALKHGRMAAWHMNKQQNFQLKQYALAYHDQQSRTQLASMGRLTQVSTDVALTVSFSQLSNGLENIAFQGHWIVDGKVVKKITANMADSQPNTVYLHLPKGKHVIRFQIPAQHGVRLETNPFLVEVRNE